MLLASREEHLRNRTKGLPCTGTGMGLCFVLVGTLHCLRWIAAIGLLVLSLLSSSPRNVVSRQKRKSLVVVATCTIMFDRSPVRNQNVNTSLLVFDLHSFILLIVMFIGPRKEHHIYETIELSSSIESITMSSEPETTNARPNKEDRMSPRNRRRRKGLFVCSMLSTVLYVGAYFGWGPMQLLVRPVYHIICVLTTTTTHATTRVSTEDCKTCTVSHTFLRLHCSLSQHCTA